MNANWNGYQTLESSAGQGGGYPSFNLRRCGVRGQTRELLDRYFSAATTPDRRLPLKERSRCACSRLCDARELINDTEKAAGNAPMKSGTEITGADGVHVGTVQPAFPVRLRDHGTRYDGQGYPDTGSPRAKMGTNGNPHQRF